MQQIAHKTEGGLLVPTSSILAAGEYHGQIIRNGEVVDEFVEKNLVVNEGLNNMLDVMFHAGTQTTTWYVGLFGNNYTPTATLTAATVTATAGEVTGYSSSTRPEFVEAAASSQSITNSASRASFVFTADDDIYGAFLVSTSAKNGTTGTLFSAARFSAFKSVVIGDELLLTYTLSAASA